MAVSLTQVHGKARAFVDALSRLPRSEYAAAPSGHYGRDYNFLRALALEVLPGVDERLLGRDVTVRHAGGSCEICEARFVEKLATKIIEVGHGDAVVFPGTYLEFLWHKSQLGDEPVAPPTKKPEPAKPKREPSRPVPQASPNGDGAVQHEARKRQRSEERRQKQAAAQLQSKIADLESRIADREQAIRELEATMAAPGFYDNHEAAKPLIDRHQMLMWEVGDLMHQWEELHAAGQATSE